MAVNIALIGAGLFAKDAHIPAIKALSSNYNLKAIWSKTRKSAEEAAKLVGHEVAIYSDEEGLDELLKRSDIQAVDVLVPPMNTAALVEKCFRAGKHVISEKPVAGTHEDAVKLVHLYRTQFMPAGLIWAVNENWAFEPNFLRVRNMLQSGLLGKLIAITCQLQLHVSPDDRYFNAFWRKGTHQPGGFVTDGGVHHIAALRVMGGEVTRVNGAVAHNKDFIPKFDTYAGTFEFQNGAIGTMLVTFAASQAAAVNKSVPQYIVIAEKGTILVNRSDLKFIGLDNNEAPINWKESMAIEHSLKSFSEGVSQKKHEYYSAEEALKDLALATQLMSKKGTENQ